MQASNYHTYNEIKSQTEAWAQAIALVRETALPRAGNPSQIFTRPKYLSIGIGITDPICRP